jgi:AcrR family transcriptional regulator
MEALSRVERKKLAARTRILEAAEELFLKEDGYSKTTIRDIAELADVSTGAVYMHFASKPDIMAVLLDQIIVDYSASFAHISEKKAGIKQIEEYVGHFFNLIRQPKFLAYLHYIERLNPGEVSSDVAESIKERGKKFYFLMRDAIAAGQDDGSIQKLGSPGILAFIFLHVTRSFARDIMEKSFNEPLSHFPELSLDGVIELLKKMLISSIEIKSSE